MIVGLFPELLGAGGVQRAGRHIAAALAAYARRAGMGHSFLSLNDPAGCHSGAVGERGFLFRGFGRAKARFVSAALHVRLARPRLVVAAHPNLAPVGWMMKRTARDLRMVVVAYGIDVWSRLPAHRRWAVLGADVVLAPSSDTAHRLVTVQRLPERRVGRLPLGLDPEFIGPAAPGHCSMDDHREFPDGRVVLTVGRQAAADRLKGIDVLIEALSRLLPGVPQASLVVIGEGADRPRLERLARELGVAHRVWFLGSVPTDTLAAAYRHCDVFALPSKKEGFGLVFLEAMAFGKPVVAGAHGGAPDIIQDGVTGYLVPYGEVEQLARVLERLLTDDGLRKNMGRRAQEWVSSAYLFEHFERRLTGILEDLHVTA